MAYYSADNIKFSRLLEAALKTVKRHMLGCIGRTKLFVKDFTKLLTQNETVLNSRPIASTSNDANDALAVTPGHFLIGRPVTALPEPKTTRKETTSLTQQKKSMDIFFRHFSEMWSTEYLSNLQQRKKWKTGQTNNEINVVAIFKKKKTQPTLWPIRLITKFFDENEKTVRVVELKISSGLIIRPVNKLVF